MISFSGSAENRISGHAVYVKKSRKMQNVVKGAAAAVLTMTMAAALAVPSVTYADTAESGSSDTAVTPVTTTVSGFETTHNRKDYKRTMTDTIKVAPAYGRQVKLYHYNPDTKKWVKENTYTTSDSYQAVVTLKFSDFWKSRSTSQYKIVMDAVKGDGSSYSGSSTSEEAVQSEGAAKLSSKMTTTFNPVSAKTAVVMNADTHELVYQKNADTERKPSSMTKMMTAILLRQKFSLNHKVTITSEAARTPWGIGLKTGDTMTVRNLLYAMLLPSANDAACASGIAVGGTTSNFASMMNAKAQELGCTRTVYKNAHGLDTTGNYSTARDQALVGSYIMTASDMNALRSIAKKKSKVIYSGKGRKYTLYSTDALLGTGTFQGLKTGTTTLGGYSFCGAYTVDGQMYVSVVMGSSSSSGRFTDTKTLAGLTDYLEGNAQD
ncbi:MAG: D-alanyl-D-alanine carboxypeptidase family protein [Eubacterium sp.]